MRLIDLLETAVSAGEAVASAQELKETTLDTALGAMGGAAHLSDIISTGAAAKDRLDELAARPEDERPGVLGVVGVAGRILLGK